ncbi:MAG: hypothetical protein JXA33_09530 [Anaerolineae bacterium]|nr:hypothetical protein [Anaerolineae bacterium]
MELQLMFKILMRWWWLVVIPVIVVIAITAFTYHSPPLNYQVVMRFSTGGEPAGQSEDYDRYYAWLSSEYIANGLADIAQTGAFATAVAQRLNQQGLNITPAAIQAAIVSDNAQSVFVIYITWTNPEQLITLAEAISDELTENGAAYYPQIGDIGITARRVDTPTPIPLPLSLKAQLLGPLLRLTLAMAVGLGLAFLAHYLDPFVREPENLQALEIPILVNIPRH